MFWGRRSHSGDSATALRSHRAPAKARGVRIGALPRIPEELLLRMLRLRTQRRSYRSIALRLDFFTFVLVIRRYGVVKRRMRNAARTP